MAYQMNTGNRYYKDGYLSNKYHGAFRRSGFQNHYSNNFNYGYNHNSSQQEDDEPSLMELMESFIHTTAKANDDFEDQLKEFNEKIDQDDRSYQAQFPDMELKFNEMEERFANELAGQPIQNIQQNPSPHSKSSWYFEEDYYSEDEDRISPKFYESGLDAGRNEQQNENPAELYMTASQSTDPLRCSEASNCSPWGFQYSSASQSSHAESEGVVEFCLDDFDEVKHEPEAEIEVEEPKRAKKIIEHPEIKAYTIESEYEDSDDEDWFKELNELTMKDNLEENIGKIEREELEVSLNGLETVSPMNVKEEFNLDNKFQESIEEVEGEVIELLDNDVNNIKSETFEDEKEDVDGMTKEEFGKWLDNSLTGLETVSPIEVYEEFNFKEDMEFFEALDREPGRRMEEELEVKNKPPELTEPKMQGMYDFIDKLVSLLSCRTDGSLGKVMASLNERKRKKLRIYFDYWKKFIIYINSKRWFDAWVNHFYGLFVRNEATSFYDCL